MSVICKGPTFIIFPGPHEFSWQAWLTISCNNVHEAPDTNKSISIENHIFHAHFFVVNLVNKIASIHLSNKWCISVCLYAGITLGGQKMCWTELRWFVLMLFQLVWRKMIRKLMTSITHYQSTQLPKMWTVIFSKLFTAARQCLVTTVSC